MSDRLMTLDQVAAELSCSPSTLKRRMRAGVLPTFRDGRIVRVRESDLGRFVLERVVLRVPASVSGPAGRELPAGVRLWD